MKRRVFGRLKNVEVGKALFTFELTMAGLKVRQRNSRTVKELGFDRLTNGGGLEVVVDNKPVKFSLSSQGLHLRNGKKEKVLPYDLLSNLARDQMELFIK